MGWLQKFPCFIFRRAKFNTNQFQVIYALLCELDASLMT